MVDSVQPLQKFIALAQIIWEGYYFYQNNYFSDSLGRKYGPYVQMYIS